MKQSWLTHCGSSLGPWFCQPVQQSFGLKDRELSNSMSCNRNADALLGEPMLVNPTWSKFSSLPPGDAARSPWKWTLRLSPGLLGLWINRQRRKLLCSWRHWSWPPRRARSAAPQWRERSVGAKQKIPWGILVVPCPKRKGSGKLWHPVQAGRLTSQTHQEWKQRTTIRWGVCGRQRG